MKTITIHRLALRFDAGQLVHGTADTQAERAVAIINDVLLREAPSLNAELIATPDEIEVEIETDEQAEE